MVYALHAPFAGVRDKGTLVNVCSHGEKTGVRLWNHVLKDKKTTAERENIISTILFYYLCIPL